jgi:hypothetical protein
MSAPDDSYRTAPTSELIDDLLDNRLYQPYWWPAGPRSDRQVKHGRLTLLSNCDPTRQHRNDDHTLPC